MNSLQLVTMNNSKRTESNQGTEKEVIPTARRYKDDEDNREISE